MASIVLKKRNFSQMLESVKMTEESMLAPKRFIDDQGNFASSFNHYLERLQIMFPEIPANQLSAELTSNQNDVIKTIENIRSHLNKTKISNTVENPQTLKPCDRTIEVSIESKIDETIAVLAQCSDINLARHYLLEFSKNCPKVNDSQLDEQSAKKILAENEILKQAFKFQQKNLIKSIKECKKANSEVTECKSELEQQKMMTQSLLNMLKDLEHSNNKGMNFTNQPIF